jgi:two-component system, chemotaxis family, response regulator Rcp1
MLDKSKQKKFVLLLVDDSEADVRLTRESFVESGIDIDMHVAMDGEQAMDFLHKRNGYEKMPRPDIVLLDLNMPKKDGREVLAEIKTDDALKLIPVIVLSMSRSYDDIELCYTLHANSYISKPVKLEEFIKVIKAVNDFWFLTVRLPNKHEETMVK